MDVKAYAKVNLGLRVIGKRPDGFHNIETVFYRINLYDELSLIKHNSVILTSSHPSLPTNVNNLCWKAVELLREELLANDGIAINLIKKIPIGAGLGGGSSDAAAVLKVLPVLWKKQVEYSTLQKVALSLGSDVPFFLQNQSAYAEGRGEILFPINISMPYWMVVVNPGIHISTPWAYNALSEKRNGQFPQRTSLKDIFSLSPLQYIATAKNDFEEVVIEKFPEIGEIKKNFLQLKAVHALMSGSGSSVFGLFENEARARDAIKVFMKDFFVSITEPNFSVS